MALVVQKFGGTSVGSIERIRNVARRAIAAQRRGNRVVLVVSAMSGETNRLLALAHEIANVPDAREMDVLAATGEQVSAALTAICIGAEGGTARSLLGHQVKVLTDDAFTKARIRAIEGCRISKRSIVERSPSLPGSRGSTTLEISPRWGAADLTRAPSP